VPVGITTQPTVVKVNNGQQAKTAAPTVEPRHEEERAPWDNLSPDTEDLTAKADTAPRSGRKGRDSARKLAKESGTLLKPGSRKWLLITAVGGGVLLIALIVGLYLAFSGGSTASNSTEPSATPAATTHIVMKGTGVELVADALKKARAGDRILVREPSGIHEEGQLRLDGDRKLPKNLTVYADPDRPVTWRLPATAPNKDFLLEIANTEGLQLRGFTFDGQGQSGDLIRLRGVCPGTTIENLQLQGFRNRAVYVLNCEGKSEAPVSLSSLQATTAAPVIAEAGLYFETRKNWTPFHTLNVVVRDCSFEGPYSQAPILTSLEATAPMEKTEFIQNRQRPAADKPWAVVQPQAAAPAAK